MMNFMGSSSNPGLYHGGQMGSKGMLPFAHQSSSSSASSSSSQHKGLVPLNYHQQQQHHQRDNPDDDNDDLGHVLVAGARSDSSDALGGGRGSRDVAIEKEHMFDKVVTPSDVGKLNRLVIPKQHAERYFPLDSSTNERGLLMNFEDRNGKPWRFRYSYWNSSQSYVMTKGWSRFVKDKKLDAGDIVSFQRGVGELGKDRLFIDWRRRLEAPELSPSLPTLSLPQHFPNYHPSIHTWNPLFLQPPPPAHTISYGHGSGPYAYSSVISPSLSSVIYLRSAAAASGGPAAGAAASLAPQQVGMVQVGRRGTAVETMVLDSVPVVHGKAAAKRLRLFGVNMECPMSESDECDSTITTHSTMAVQLPHLSSYSSSSNPAFQLRPYNGTPLQTVPSELLSKGKSSMSLDLDI